MNILPFFPCLSNLMPAATLRQLQIIAAGMLCSSGRSTQLGISGCTEKGGSYRTINRFSHTKIDWDKVLQQFRQTPIMTLQRPIFSCPTRPLSASPAKRRMDLTDSTRQWRPSRSRERLSLQLQWPTPISVKRSRSPSTKSIRTEKSVSPSSWQASDAPC